MAYIIAGIEWGEDFTAIAMKCTGCSKVIYADVAAGGEEKLDIPLMKICPKCRSKITMYTIKSE